MMTAAVFVALLTVGLLPASSISAAQSSPRAPSSQRPDRLHAEERDDYFQKWLSQDVVYIISPQEKEVFSKLSTPEEKENFIEQFWYRRDPDLSTSQNEFKEEHYRRIAYANESFASGVAGWMSDRGRVYIIHGPPAQIESRPSGGTYNRPLHEGGGTTSTFPFETWRYRYIPGLGNDVVLEFVDPTMTGEYRLALNPEEKDAMLHVPGLGLTLAEELGLGTRADRPFLAAEKSSTPYYLARSKDNPFERYETYLTMQRPVQLKYRDFQEVVEIQVTFDKLPLQVRRDYFRLNEQRLMIPITVHFDNKELTFRQEANTFTAQVAVYGIVTDLTNHIVAEFENDVQVSLPREQFSLERMGKSAYQKLLLLDRRGRYKLTLVVKDLGSSKVGVVREALIPPSVSDDALAISSLVLSSFVRQLPEIPRDDQMFVLGDIWIRPSPSNVFYPSTPFNVYLQVYNFGLDQTTSNPAISVRYQILDERGQPVVGIEEQGGESIHYFSEQRIVLMRGFDLKELPPGRYALEVTIRDLIKQQTTGKRETFRVLSPAG